MCQDLKEVRGQSGVSRFSTGSLMEVLTVPRQEPTPSQRHPKHIYIYGTSVLEVKTVCKKS